MISGGPEVGDVLDAHAGWIKSEVLATELVSESSLSGTYHETLAFDLYGISADVAITRV